MFGYTVEEAIGADMAKLILPTRLQDAHRRGFARSATAITAGDVPQRMAMETSARHRDGREFPVELLVTAASEPAGLVFNGLLRDITERRRAHETLAAAHAELGSA